MHILNPLLLLLINVSSILCLKVAVGNFDAENDDNKLYFDISKPLVLKCEADAESDVVAWSKFDEDGNKNALENGDRVSITKVGPLSTLKISGSSVKDDGRYACEANGKSLEINTVAKPIARVKPNDVSVIDGERLVLKCLAYGSDLRVEWTFPNTTADDRVEFEDYEVSDDYKIKDGQLVIKQVQMSDRGTYECVARVDDLEERYPAFVRIKDKYAALWPFIFICIEVFVLCSIILIYEKKRNKTDVDDSETDIAPETKNGKK